MPDIFLYVGEANPSDVKLRDPTVAADAGSVTVNPAGFAVPVAFGAPTLDVTLGVTGFAPTVSFGTATLSLQIAVTGFAPVVAFGNTTTDGAAEPPVVDVPASSGGEWNLALPPRPQPISVSPKGFRVPIKFGVPVVSLVGPTRQQRVQQLVAAGVM